MRSRTIIILVLAILAATSSGAVGCRSASAPPTVASRDVAPPPATPVDAAALGATDVGEAAATVLVSGMRFQPDRVRIRAGEAVAWVFNDPGVIHSVTAFDRSFDSGLRASGTFVVRFDTPGTYCYQCLPHPGPNRCEQGAVPVGGPRLLAGRPLIDLGMARRNRAGGGGGMQGTVIVEE